MVKMNAALKIQGRVRLSYAMVKFLEAVLCSLKFPLVHLNEARTSSV